MGTPEAGALVGAGVGAGVAFGAGVGVGAGGCVGNGACAGQELPPAGGEDRVQLLDVVFHVHGPMLDRADLGEVKVTGDQVVQHPQLVLVQIVLGDLRVPHHGKLPGKAPQAHELLLRVRPRIDDLRSGMSVGCIVQLVLHDLEEAD